MITGLPPHQTGSFDNDFMPSDMPSFMERLATEGYQTHGVGKMHFVPDPRHMWGFHSRDFSEESPAADDFRTFLDERGYRHVEDPHGVRSEMYYIPQPSQLPAALHHTAWTADRSIEFLRRRDRKRPFFLWTSFHKPHPPFESPTPWNKLYRTAEISGPFRPEGSERLLCYWNRVQNRYKYRDHGYDELLVRTIRAAYYSCISFIDYHVGRILEALRDEMDNTLVVFTSDHGELLGDYGSFGKRCMLEAAVRVPLIARWPGHIPASLRCHALSSLLDLWPTFLSAAGAKDVQVSDEGVSLTDVLSGDDRRDMVFSQYQHRGYGLYLAASATGKYIYSEPDQREWFFDPAGDPLETLDCCNHPLHAGAAARMRMKLIQRFHRDKYTQPLEGDSWRAYPQRHIPDDPNAGLLFQDARGLQERIDALGPYARPVTVTGPEAIALLLPKYT